MQIQQNRGWVVEIGYVDYGHKQGKHLCYHSILDAVYDFAVTEKWYKMRMEAQILDEKYL